MNTELRRRLVAEAMDLAERHPADLDRAVALGQQRLRSRLMVASVLTAVVVLAVAAALIVVRLWGTGGPGPNPATIVGVAVTAPGHTLELGTKVQATATAALSDGGSRVLEGGVVWASEDPAVVAVDGAGLVTAVGTGSAGVTAAFGGHEGRAAFEVTDGTTPSPSPSILRLRVDPSSTTVEAGDKGTLNAHFIYSDGSTAAPALVQWTSSDLTVATVQGGPNGEATGTAVAAGTATITAVAKDAAGTAFEATATVTVNPPAVVRITIDPPQLPILYAGDKPVKLTATVVYRDGTSGTSDLVAWASTDSGIANVDSRGYVYPEAHGTAKITATLGDVTSPPVMVTVKQID